MSADFFIQSSLEQGGSHGETLQQEVKQVIHYTYDANGNMIKDDKAEYHYDGFNRLSEVRTTDGRYQRNTYDAEGLRAELIENNELVRFLYYNGEVVAETNEKQEITRYIRGLGLISSDSEKAKTYYHYASDERGSITDIVKAAVKKKLAEDAKKESATQNPNHEASPVGNVTTTANEQQQETGVLNHYEYDAFGNTLVCEEQVENRFRFTGEIYDSVTGQYYLRARFYNPVLGRFIQEDDRYDDGLNLYAYCRNNPVKYTDPSGHGTTSGSDRVDDNADFYEDLYDSQYDTIPEYEDFLQDMQDAQNEGTNQSALYDLVDEMNQSGGLDAEDQSTIHDWADEYGVDYDSLGVNAADEGGGVIQGVGNSVNVEGRGSTGRTTPNTLNEQMAMHQVMSNPLEGAIDMSQLSRPIIMTDPRWPASEGWVKMSNNVNGIEIHFVYNKITGAFDDFKFK